MEYGNVALSVSNINAYPDNSSYYLNEIEVLVRPQYFTGQSLIDLCPNVNQFAQPGTYAFSVQASTPSELYVEVLTSNQTYPIPQSSDRVSCDEILNSTYYNDSSVQCFEEGETYLVEREIWYLLNSAMILPVPAGCHTISLSVASYGASFNDGDLFCHPLNPDEYLYWIDYDYAENYFLQGRSMTFHFIRKDCYSYLDLG